MKREDLGPTQTGTSSDKVDVNEIVIKDLDVARTTLKKIENNIRKLEDKVYDTDNTDSGDEVQKARYPRRSVSKKDYREAEIPDDDHFIFCDDCENEYEGDCPIHGPLLVIEDKKIPADGSDPLRADHSIPNNLSIGTSGIKNAGAGVWAKVAFPKGVRFGPYEGVITYDSIEAHQSGYAWQIYKNGRPNHFVNARDKSMSNWLRYVNCACNEEQQNLVAFQYHGQIFYRTYKPIPPGSELLVWYGDAYAKELGITRGDKNYTHKRVMDKDCSETCVCGLCGICLTSDEAVAKHEKRNGDQAVKIKYKCSQCCYSCDYASYLSSHMLTHTRERPHKCEVCGMRFTWSSSLNRHSRKHTGEKPFTCEVCGMRFTWSSHLKVHSMKHTGEKPFTCEVCGMRFTQSSSLNRHSRKHAGEKPFTCEVCGMRFTWSSHLKVHSMKHTGEKPFTCEVCGMRFTQSSSLNRHSRKHTGEKPFTCEVCGMRFTQSSSLNIHSRKHTGEKPFTCEVCGMRFTWSSSLNRHSRKHTGEKPFTCEVCGMRFIQSSHLNIHSRKHTGEKPFTCEVCGMRFTQSSHLKVHSRKHTGEKPFTCEVCGMRFTQSIHLNRHSRKHTGEKPFTCEVCGMRFTRSSHLKVHSRKHTGEGGLIRQEEIHTGQKPYPCSRCGLKFRELYKLSSHIIVVHTKAYKHRSPQCNKGFRVPYLVRKHQRSEHGPEE
ncbi:uncharacterized protein LOC143253494 isoform X2 [Tachypleus tridentatus]